MPSKAELAIFSLIDLFRSYSSKDGDPKHLSKSEMKILFEKEFPNFLSECKDPAEFAKYMSDLDINNDGKVDFNEFVIMITTLSMICNGILEETEGK